MNIIIAGIQGAGKGTHGKRLAEMLKIPHISFGDAIHKHLIDVTGVTDPYTLNDYNSGILAPDDTLFNVAHYELKPSRVKKGFILDGFPRTPGQHQFVANNYLIDVCIVLDIPDEIAVERLMARGRVDDTKKGIARRLEQFKTITRPTFKYYIKHKKYITVDTNQPIEDTFAEILEKLQPFLKK
jgi:adenylate kinase